MELTFKTAGLLNAVQLSNVKTHIVFLGYMYVMENGIVEKVLIKKSSLVCGNQIICEHMYKCKKYVTHVCARRKCM